MRHPAIAAKRVLQRVTTLGLFALCGCGGVYTSKSLNVAGETNGIVYALPTSWIEINGVKDDKDKITITLATKELPDAGRMYTLDHTASAFSDDDIAIEVGRDQLLDRVYAKTKDRTGDVVVAVARAATGLASFSVPGAAASRDVEFVCGLPDKFPFTNYIDPFNPSTFPTWLKPPCLRLTPVAAAEAAPASRAGRADEDCRKGLCYRAPVPYRIGFDFGGAGYREVMVGLLNNAPILSVRVDRAMFVEKKVELKFDNGVLSKMEINQPSSALALATLPLEVAKATLAAPAEIFKLRVDYASQAMADMEKEKALIEAQRKFDEYKASLAEKSTPAPDTKSTD